MPVCRPRVSTAPPVWKTRWDSPASVRATGPDTPAPRVTFGRQALLHAHTKQTHSNIGLRQADNVEIRKKVFLDHLFLQSCAKLNRSWQKVNPPFWPMASTFITIHQLQCSSFMFATSCLFLSTPLAFSTSLLPAIISFLFTPLFSSSAPPFMDKIDCENCSSAIPPKTSC